MKRRGKEKKEKRVKLVELEQLRVSSYPERDRVDKAPLVFCQFLYSPPSSLTEAQPYTPSSTGYFNPSSVPPPLYKKQTERRRMGSCWDVVYLKKLCAAFFKCQSKFILKYTLNNT